MRFTRGSQVLHISTSALEGTADRAPSRPRSAVSVESCRVSCSAFPHDVPATANHVVGDGPTKMIGAKHGLGSATVASISFDSGLLIRRQRNSRLRAPYPTDA